MINARTLKFCVAHVSPVIIFNTKIKIILRSHDDNFFLQLQLNIRVLINISLAIHHRIVRRILFNIKKTSQFLRTFDIFFHLFNYILRYSQGTGATINNSFGKLKIVIINLKPLNIYHILFKSENISIDDIISF